MDKPAKTTKATEKPAFPMRINKYLALKGFSTRRGADELIEKKRVTINGRIAVLGDKVQEKDVVELKQSGPGQAGKPKIYIAYNKPRNEQTEEINVPGGVFPIGRLDKMSEGLIIMTNDGRITDRLLNPEYEHEKEYVVTVKEKLRNNFKEKMEAGVDIEGYVTKPCKVAIINDHTFNLTISEGKKHQIRRMCVALFNEVRDLKRLRIMNIKLGNLASGQTRPIEGDELKTFLKALGL